MSLEQSFIVHAHTRTHRGFSHRHHSWPKIFQGSSERHIYPCTHLSDSEVCDSHPFCCHPHYCRSSLLPCTRVHQIGSKLLRDEPLVPKETLQNEGARATGSSFAAPPTPAFFSFLPRELFAGGREGCLNSSADPFSKVNMQLCKSLR